MERRDGRAIDRLHWRATTTHCIHCGIGCQLELRQRAEKEVWISDAVLAAPNWASTCRRGRFQTYDSWWFGERVLQPMVRQKGRLKEASWPKAVQSLLDGFSGVKEKYGAGALGALVSPRSTNEAVYLLQKLLRAGWQSNGIDFPGREAGQKLFSLMQTYGDAPGVNQELAGLGQVETIFLVGDGIEETAPVIAAMIRRAVRNRKTTAVQLSSRSDGLTPFAGTAVQVPSELWPAIIQELARAAAGKVTSSFDAGKHGMKAEEWSNLQQILTARSAVALVFPAALLGSAKTEPAVSALFDLASAGGWMEGKAGAGLYPLTAEINTVGALLMGASPDFLPGFVAVADDVGRNKLARIWQVSELPDATLPGIEKGLETKRIKGLIVQEAALLFKKDADHWKKLFSGLEFLALIETVPSKALELAKVVLPAAAFGEQTGTVINSEGRLLGLAKTFAREGSSLPDLEIISQIMATKGIAFPRDMTAIREEIKALVPQLRDCSWDADGGERARMRFGR